MIWGVEEVGVFREEEGVKRGRGRGRREVDEEDEDKDEGARFERGVDLMRDKVNLVVVLGRGAWLVVEGAGLDLVVLVFGAEVAEGTKSLSSVAVVVPSSSSS